MSVERYAEWLARGRTHQAGDRFIDALLCYRRALREVPRGVDAQFHIGEIAWRTGNRDDALAAWRIACESGPAHLPSWHALADACAAVGDIEASGNAVSRVLSLRPDEGRAKALGVVLSAAAAPADDEALVAALRSDVWPVALLARVIEHVVASGATGTLVQSMPALLAAATSAPVVRGDEDALRRIALALARAGDVAAARVFADRYGEACRVLHRASTPLGWPLRTAGDRMRVGLLIVADREHEAAALLDALRGDDALHVDCMVLVQAGALAQRPDIDGRVLPAELDAAARAIATLDLDVLVDVAGVRASVGPLLARRPARRIWTIDGPDCPSPRALADRVIGGADARAFDSTDHATCREVRAALRELQHVIAAEATSPLTAAQLASRWEAAITAHREGDAPGARAGYAAILEAQPGHAPALYLAGEVALRGLDEAAAREHFRAAIAAAPGYAEPRIALADALLRAGDAEEARATARAGLDHGIDVAALWRVLGRSEQAAGQVDAAIAAFEESLRREPTHGETHYNHGVALQTARRTEEAARAYQRALAFAPQLYAADFNLGVIFEQQANAAAAIAAFSNVLRRVPDHVASYKALAEVLRASGRIDAWFANFERFERHCPDHLALAAHALVVCAHRADFARLERYLDGLRHERFTAGTPDETLDALQQLLYLLHFFDVEPDLIARHASTHDALSRRVYGEPMPRRTQRAPGKLRIGYISGDFRNHVMGKMMWEVLRRHDHARFDIFAYATTQGRDDWTARIEAIVPRFASVDALGDQAAARRIADDDLDVLVDLSTHTKGARPGVLARKPARVQITHVASAGTLAMSAIDFKLTDRYADTAADAAQSIETLLAMEGCVYPYRHVEASPTAPFVRASLGIARDAVVIGAFCTPLKLSQRCLALWREVLARIPRAVLAFSPVHPALGGVFGHIADVAGIARDRIVFVPQGRDDAEGQARYRLVDFVLDPMPYGGVNGTLEAVAMNVPVVTLVGRRHAERTSYSILANLGVTDTVAETGGDYVALAVRLATDAAFMHTVRERIAAGIRLSPLTDMDAHVRHLEAAYVEALARRAPDALAAAR
jgi:predicted O-linked N-acetylglucosamine transferase (SPINDLY family)